MHPLGRQPSGTVDLLQLVKQSYSVLVLVDFQDVDKITAHVTLMPTTLAMSVLSLHC